MAEVLKRKRSSNVLEEIPTFSNDRFVEIDGEGGEEERRSKLTGWRFCWEKEDRYPWNWVLCRKRKPYSRDEDISDPLYYVDPPWTPSICEQVFEKLDSGDIDIDYVDDDLKCAYVALKVWNKMQSRNGGPQFELVKPIVSNDWLNMKKGSYFHANVEVKPKDDPAGEALLLFAEVRKHLPRDRDGLVVYLATVCCPVQELPSDCSEDEINNGCLSCLPEDRIYHPSSGGFEFIDGPQYRISPKRSPNIYHPPSSGFGWDTAVYTKKKRSRRVSKMPNILKTESQLALSC